MLKNKNPITGGKQHSQQKPAHMMPLSKTVKGGVNEFEKEFILPSYLSIKYLINMQNLTCKWNFSYQLYGLWTIRSQDHSFPVNKSTKRGPFIPQMIRSVDCSFSSFLKLSCVCRIHTKINQWKNGKLCQVEFLLHTNVSTVETFVWRRIAIGEGEFSPNGTTMVSVSICLSVR